jgi:hypothetical protein
MGLTLSASERAQNVLRQDDRLPRDSLNLLDLKKSLHILFKTFIGQNPKCGPVKNFQLASKSKNNSVDTLIFATAIRHDLDKGSILLDAYVVPLTESRVEEMPQALQSFVNSKALLVFLSDKQCVLWKQLIRSLADRCRTWVHKASCEYRTRGCVPLSTAHGETPLCWCGEGQDLEKFPTGGQLRSLGKYATRIAISPLFTVDYVESLPSKKAEGEFHDWTGSYRPKRAPPATTAPGVGASYEGCGCCGVWGPDLKACAACGMVRYCDRDCQKAAWKEHKPLCEKKRLQ